MIETMMYAGEEDRNRGGRRKGTPDGVPGTRSSTKQTLDRANARAGRSSCSRPSERRNDEENDALIDGTEDDAMAEVDALQALNTALCFLVSINADAQCVEDFLLSHPGALLLEGTGHVPEESAAHILAAQMQSCQCFSPLCQSNRQAVQKLLDRGFEHYSARRLLLRDDEVPVTSPDSGSVGGVRGVPSFHWKRADFINWGRVSTASSSMMVAGWESTAYGHRMRVLERSVRIARRTELRLRHDVLEAAMRVRDLDAERRRCRRDSSSTMGIDEAAAGQAMAIKSIWTLCSQRQTSQLPGASTPASDSSVGLEVRARISAFEYELRMAQLRLSSLEREHAEQLRQIRSARRFQFGILKRSFEDCRRHVCLTVIADAAGPSEAT